VKPGRLAKFGDIVVEGTTPEMTKTAQGSLRSLRARIRMSANPHRQKIFFENTRERDSVSRGPFDEGKTSCGTGEVDRRQLQIRKPIERILRSMSSPDPWSTPD